MVSRIYLDACCLNRPFDDQASDRIRIESEAVLLILRHLQSGAWHWIGSEVLELELERTPDGERRGRTLALYSSIKQSVRVGEREARRANELQAMGFQAFDALHLACAESAKCHALLTTDDRLLRLAARKARDLRIKVANPLDWLTEALGE
ncbi:MAG: PIN domain-containing protein [Acidobacteria bacterium]|nr:PIN domain-containing protein [Acidobacteriota bacterium]